jgi:prepilin-type N-terminal cleavage/methylation domain-containing protein
MLHTHQNRKRPPRKYGSMPVMHLPLGKSAGGFTLVELLVVIAIIGLLVALLLPAVQAARGSARRMGCSNNLRQLALAVQNYQSARKQYPPSILIGKQQFRWSAQARILPYLEQGNLFAGIDFQQSYDEPFIDGQTLSSMRVPALLCPSEVRDEVRLDGDDPIHYPLNYGVNCGLWKVYNPKDQSGGSGAFFPNSGLSPKSFRDGLSNTLMLAEVKGWTPYYRDGGGASETLPNNPSEICSLGGKFKTSSGHTEWVDGRVHQIGFTATFTPGTRVACQVGGQDYDVDWTNHRVKSWEPDNPKGYLQESIVTYATITARSYHVADSVNVSMMDGSVRPVATDIDLGIWRAMATRAGGDLVENGD